MLSEAPEGTPHLTVLGAVDSHALTLYADEPVQIGDREYVFGGRREFAGIEVRRDPGVNSVWVRMRSGETVVAGLAERSGVSRAEAKQLASELGAPTDASQGGGMDA